MRLSDAIKELALGAVNAESPVDVMPAEIVSVSPLSIKIRDNDKLVIPSDLLVVAEHLRNIQGK